MEQFYAIHRGRPLGSISELECANPLARRRGAIPSDNDIRLMLDGAASAAFDGLFFKAIEAAGPLTPFQCLDERVLIALDGTVHHCSRKITCKQCSTRRRSDGGTEYFHAFLGASMVAPGHKQVLPLPPELSGQARGHVHRAARRGGKAGLRTQRRHALAGPAGRGGHPSSAGLSR
jgi:hypothetical protein